MTDGKLSLLQAAKEIGHGVTYDMLMGACIRGELRYDRAATRLYIFREDIEWLKEWFLERARLKDKEAAIGKHDMDGRSALRELAKERIRQSHNPRGQKDSQALPGRVDGPGITEPQGGKQC